MPHQESIAQLKQAIKDWEHEFQRSNNRIPSRQDIKTDPKIYGLYKTYKALKSGTNGADKIKNKKTLEPSHVGIDINILESQSDIEDIEEADCLVFAVAHDEFINLTQDEILKMYNQKLEIKDRVLIDIKGIFDQNKLINSGLTYWRL